MSAGFGWRVVGTCLGQLEGDGGEGGAEIVLRTYMVAYVSGV